MNLLLSPSFLTGVPTYLVIVRIKPFKDRKGLAHVWTTVNTQSFPSFIHSSNKYIEYALHFKWYSGSQEDSGNRTEDPCHPVREERQQTLWHLVKVLYEQTKQKGVGEDWRWRRGFSILNGVENSICQMPPIFKHISISEMLKYFKAHFTTMKCSSKKSNESKCPSIEQLKYYKNTSFFEKEKCFPLRNE